VKPLRRWLHGFSIVRRLLLRAHVAERHEKYLETVCEDLTTRNTSLTIEVATLRLHRDRLERATQKIGTEDD
jgi:hypothetical protein